jgi:taurine dioxygenase
MTWAPTPIAAAPGLNAAGSQYRHVSVTPLGGVLGATIGKVDLSQALDDETVAEIRRALLDHLVIFFHDQDITPARHKAFGAHFGAFYRHEFVAGMNDEHPEIIVVAKTPEDQFNFGGVWHSDITYAKQPPLGSILHAREVPPHGGDTLFANQYLAYEMLSKGMKAMVGGLSAVHSAKHVYGARGALAVENYQDGQRGTDVIIDDAAEEESIHPIVRTHPETGRKALYVNAPFTVGIEGMKREESEPILDYLYSYSTRPDFTCRFAWRKNSIAFWDNRCVQHYALNDYPGQERIMHRLTINGDTPF